MFNDVKEKVKAGVVIAQDNSLLEVKSGKAYAEKHKYFSMIQELRMKNSRVERMDLLDRLADVSRSAFRLFNEIKLNTDRQSLISIMSAFGEANSTQRREINRRLAELRKQDLLIKLKTLEKYPSLEHDMKHITLVPEKLSFMLNPYLIRPKNYKRHQTNFKKAKILWHFNKGEGYKVREILNEKKED